MKQTGKQTRSKCFTVASPLLRPAHEAKPNPDPTREELLHDREMSSRVTRTRKPNSMTPDDAKALAIRYKNIWHGGPNTDELRHTFQTLESHAIAADMLTKAATTLEHPPTIRALVERYHATRNIQRQGIPQPEWTGTPVSLDDALTIIGPELEPIRQLLARSKGTRP